MKAYEINNEGIFFSTEHLWEWFPLLEKLRVRYSIIFLKGENYAFMPYTANTLVYDVYSLLQAWKEDTCDNVREINF